MSGNFLKCFCLNCPTWGGEYCPRSNAEEVAALTIDSDSGAEVACCDGLNDPTILMNTVESLIYGIHNICIEEGHEGLLIFNCEQMNKIRGYIAKTLTTGYKRRIL